MCIHGITLSIISNMGEQFTSRFLRSFKKRLGTKVKLCTAFHPQKDGQVKLTIQTLEDFLDLVVVFKSNSDKHLPLLYFPTTIVVIYLYLYLIFRTCMIGDVDLQLDGLKRVSIHFWVPI